MLNKEEIMILDFVSVVLQKVKRDNPNFVLANVSLSIEHDIHSIYDSYVELVKKMIQDERK